MTTLQFFKKIVYITIIYYNLLAYTTSALLIFNENYKALGPFPQFLEEQMYTQNTEQHCRNKQYTLF